MTTLLPILRSRPWATRPRMNFFDRFFDNFDLPTVFSEDRDWMPKIDISETETDFVVSAEVPGMAKDDISITMTDGLLTLSGEKNHEHEDKKGNYHLVERRYGSFKRSMRLPENVEPDKIDAAYKEGVLTITIPKPAPVEAKKIEIKN